MADSERVLSQDEIDALLPKNVPKAQPKPPVANVTATIDVPPVASKPETHIDTTPLSFPVPAAHHENYAGKMENIEKSLNTLVQEITKLSKSVGKIDKLEERVEQISESVQNAFEILSDFDKRIKKIHKNLKEISQDKSRISRAETKGNKTEPKEITVYRVKCTVSDLPHKKDTGNNFTQNWKDSQGQIPGVNSPRPGTNRWYRQQEDSSKYPHLTPFF
jgi:uncharacterized phage infection (PIP) family protein YhgE